MEKYKYLLKNVGIMTLASFGTKNIIIFNGSVVYKYFINRSIWNV